MDKSSNLNISHMIDSISSSPIMILINFFFINHTAMATDLWLSLSNFIRPLLSIKVDRFHLDMYPTPIVDQLLSTYTTKNQVVKRSYFCTIKLQQPHCDQLCYHSLKDHSHNYSIEMITDDWVKIYIFSHMIMLSTSCSLITIHIYHSVSLYRRLETHLS